MPLAAEEGKNRAEQHGGEAGEQEGRVHDRQSGFWCLIHCSHYHGEMRFLAGVGLGLKGSSGIGDRESAGVFRLRSGQGAGRTSLSMTAVFLGLAVFVGMVWLSGCRSSGTSSATGNVQQKTFHLRGKIVATDPANGHITVDHGAIAGYMDAMTMSYKLVQPETISELHPGDIITARVVVDYDAAGPLNPRLDQIVVVGQARLDTKPAVQYHVPQAGDAVPDFKLLNQSGKTIHLGQFRGKVVLLTFIYTRCPLADFCPRMSANFSEIDKALAENKGLYAKTHLLSVSFDPKYDTPQVLRSYGGAHTGKFTEEDFKHWDFAAPTVAELPTVEQYFDVGVTGDSSDPTSIQHSLSTLVVGKDGKVIAWYPTNDWKPADVLKQVEQAAG
jgi:protein SCO1/2